MSRKGYKGNPKFDFKDKDNLIQIEEWARDGATDKAIAESIGYNYTYFNELKKKYPELSEALKRGRRPLNAIVEISLFKRATGHIINSEEVGKIKHVYYDDQGRRCSREELVAIPVKKFIPPDTTAQIFWLRNRKPDQWNREGGKPDNGDSSGDTKNITFTITEELIEAKEYGTENENTGDGYQLQGEPEGR